MATTEQPWSLQQIMDRLHTLYQNDSSTPATTDDQWAIYLRMVNQAIADWEGQDVFWNELWQTYNSSGGATGQQVGTVSQTAYAIPTSTNMHMPPQSFVRFINNSVPTSPTYLFLEVVKPEDMTKYRENARVVYFTGNPSTGFTMNLGWIPQSNDQIIGQNFAFDYYKSANQLSGTTDVPEMSDPGFIVWQVASQLHLLDSNTDLYGVYNTNAQTAMQKMKIRNELRPANSDNRPDDVEQIKDGSVFGDYGSSSPNWW